MKVRVKIKNHNGIRNNNLTEGKWYEVTFDYAYFIYDDNGDYICIFPNKCGFLNGGQWTQEIIMDGEQWAT